MIVSDSFDDHYCWPTARILELSVGIICSCLPVTTPIFRKHNLKFVPFAQIKSTLSLRNTFHRNKARFTKKARLKTSILGSAFGDGKFLKTEDLSMNTSSRNEDIEEINEGSRHLEVWVEPALQSYSIVIHITLKIQWRCLGTGINAQVKENIDPDKMHYGNQPKWSHILSFLVAHTVLIPSPKKKSSKWISKFVRMSQTA